MISLESAGLKVYGMILVSSTKLLDLSAKRSQTEGFLSRFDFNYIEVISLLAAFGEWFSFRTSYDIIPLFICQVQIQSIFFFFHPLDETKKFRKMITQT